MANEKIGILGGTFNPIHTGHLILAENAYSMFGLNKVLIMPSGVSYQKDMDVVLPASKRIDMVRLAIKDNEHLELSTIETERQGNTYTYETLELLCELYPTAEFYFILGADNLYGIEHWKNADRIFQNCCVLAAGRDHIKNIQLQEQVKYLEKKFHARISLMDTPNIDISSEMIRNHIANGISVRYLLNEDVIEYIEQHKLYRGF